MPRAPSRGLLSAVAVLALLADLALVPSVAAHARSSPRPDDRIAFWDYMSGQIYAVNPDGTGLVQVTHVASGQTAADPDWAPDGKHLAFDSDMSGDVRLWIVDPDGNHLHMLANDRPGYADYVPRYTPDGERIVFSRCAPDNGCAIYSVRIDGSHRRALTRSQGEVVDFYASMSPDATRIAFTRFNADGIFSQIYVMRSDGGGAHAITASPLEGWAPSWSPDGRRITLSSDCCGGRLGGNVYVMNADGSGLRHLTDSAFPNNDYESAYSPGGDLMVFASDRRYSDFCCSDLFVMRANGTRETFIATGLTGVLSPDWGTAPPLTAGANAETATDPALTISPTGRGNSTWCRALPLPLREKPGCAPLAGR